MEPLWSPLLDTVEDQHTPNYCSEDFFNLSFKSVKPTESWHWKDTWSFGLTLCLRRELTTLWTSYRLIYVIQTAMDGVQVGCRNVPAQLLATSTSKPNCTLNLRILACLTNAAGPNSAPKECSLAPQLSFQYGEHLMNSPWMSFSGRSVGLLVWNLPHPKALI